MGTSLKYAEAFHSLQEDELKNQALTRAKSFAEKYKNELGQLDAFCKIAQALKKLGDLQQSEEMTEKAQQLCNKQKPENFIKAHLFLAEHLLFLKDSKKMIDALDKAIEVFNKEPLPTQLKAACQLAPLLTKIAKEGIVLKPENFSVDSLMKEGFERLKNSQNELSAENRANAFLGFASAYEDLQMPKEAQEALDYAILAIESMPESTKEETWSKLNLLGLISGYENMSPEAMKKVLQLFKKYYNQGSGGHIELSILRFCNTNKLTEESTEFLNQYLSDSAHQNSDELAILADAQSLSIEQRKRLLEAAERFISKVHSSGHVRVMALIAKGYRKVDKQKSLEILNSYAKNQAVEHLTSAIITVAMGILYVCYPQHLPSASLGLGAYQLYRHLF